MANAETCILNGVPSTASIISAITSLARKFRPATKSSNHTWLAKITYVVDS